MASNKFEDLSGVEVSPDDNPYNGLIKASRDEPTQIQARYAIHRTARAEQQRAKLLSHDFPGVTIDHILKGLVDKSSDDPRWCLVFWARPTTGIRDLVGTLQQDLKSVVPNLWLMPTQNLHMTALELAHSRTKPEILALIEKIRPKIQRITDYPSEAGHRARLIRPQITYDAAAIALSYLPAAMEKPLPSDREPSEDKFTYHHLRRDIHDLCTGASDGEGGVEVGSRYSVPSAHFTIGRFIVHDDFEGSGTVDKEKVKALISKIDDLNDWLKREFWPENQSTGPNGNEVSRIKDGGEWIIGQENKGLDCRWGKLWYGGGETVRMGKGF